MVKRFFSLRIPVFGTVAIGLVCSVLFFVPFALRGARMGMQDVQNNVADWLPKEYAETQDLVEFRKHFYGDQFVVVSGPWCNEGDPVFSQFKEKIRRESLEYEATLKAAGLEEELRAHRKGDELGLLYTGNYHQSWGENNEKWLQGKNGQWYFINRKGELFRWDGQENVVAGVKRFFERVANGTNEAQGTYVATFGPPSENGLNPFYQDPMKLCCRPFKSVISGPEAFKQMAGPDGTLRIRKSGEGDLSAFEAEMEAHKILTGALFGPTPPRSFTWTFDSLLQHVDKRMQAKLTSEAGYQQVFESFVTNEINTKFDGKLERLTAASNADRLEIWYRLWHQLELTPPPRQSCFIVTLNEPIIEELSRVIGRPIMGKPRGRLLEIAILDCGIDAQNLRLGGPPYDNVAIDEEGTNTLIRLAGLSLAIGMTLAYLSFGRIRVAIMIFFVGGTAAISSLAIVWYGGSSMDAILMTMPSLVYVLGLSAAVHFVNYYRDACHELGPRKAAEVAVKHSWFPISLAAFTTALGLLSLTTSNLKPIYKFGLFSAVGVVVTVVLLFVYLPSALTIWKPGYRRFARNAPQKQSGLAAMLHGASHQIGNFVIAKYRLVIFFLLGLVVFLGLGLIEVKTTVQLLKLFDSEAKILKDYQWLEHNIGELVPAEIVVCVDKEVQKEAYAAQIRKEQIAAAKKSAPTDTPEEELANMPIEYDEHQLALRYSMLERMELSSRVRQQLEKYFGAEGMGVVGSGMSTDVFTPLYRLKSKSDPIIRFNFSSSLEAKKKEMMEQDYLAVVGEGTGHTPQIDEAHRGREMWRISIRLAALNDVDYGQFVNNLKEVVEPILNAYQYRTQILNAVHSEVGQRDESKQGNPVRILLLGRDPRTATASKTESKAKSAEISVDQTLIFVETLQDLLLNRGYERRPNAKHVFMWIDPAKYAMDGSNLNPEERAEREAFFADERFGNYIAEEFQCVVLLEDHPLFKPEVISNNAKQLVDARKHRFEINPRTRLPVAGAVTMRDRDKSGENVEVSAIYTGIVPIVYKAQRALLQSLIESIAISFVMISIVMMILLRPWGEPWRLKNLVNWQAGLISMIPNVFPILIVFGYMGWSGIDVDIGSMMTASVAMGIAVDDTIHFLTWYQHGLGLGLDRKAAIRYSYDRVAVAMIQTTLIAGLGLAAFALSTFTPTQRFGVLMLCLLVTALVGDLLLLPALLASPLGKFFDLNVSVKPNELDQAALESFSSDNVQLRVIQEETPASGSAGPPLRKWQ